MSLLLYAVVSESMWIRNFARSVITLLPWSLAVAIASLPVSPSIYALIMFGNQCTYPVKPGSDSVFLCLANLAATAPLLAMTGSLADDGADNKMWIGIILISLVIGLSCSAIGALRPSGRTSGR